MVEEQQTRKSYYPQTLTGEEEKLLEFHYKMYRITGG